MPHDSMNLITGARGQLGSHIAEQLRGAGRPVRALVRPGGDTAFLREIGVDLVEGDLADADAVRRAVAGVDTVYHCAARVSDWGSWAAFERDAGTSTRNVVDACRIAEVRRLLHVSSISVYGQPKVPAGADRGGDAAGAGLFGFLGLLSAPSCWPSRLPAPSRA